MDDIQRNGNVDACLPLVDATAQFIPFKRDMLRSVINKSMYNN